MSKILRKFNCDISFEIEESFGKNNIIFGVDEAGRGCLVGPVVAGCAWINRDEFPPSLLNKINDSKKLSEKMREEIFCELEMLPPTSFLFSYHSVNADEIDRINILEASLFAMKSAAEILSLKMSLLPDMILVDGNNVGKMEPSVAVIKGDSLSYSIAAASIIAKVIKDRLLNEIGEKYPEFMFHKNKGYGTKFHLEILNKIGPTEHHRFSYAPVKNAITK